MLRCSTTRRPVARCHGRSKSPRRRAAAHTHASHSPIAATHHARFTPASDADEVAVVDADGAATVVAAGESEATPDVVAGGGASGLPVAGVDGGVAWCAGSPGWPDPAS